jgi:hypothetical protein
MIALWLGLACATTGGSKSSPLATVHVQQGMQVKRLQAVAYRPIDAPNADAAWMVDAVPGAQWDEALAAAASELVATLRSPDRMMSPRAMATATARSGFPGAARFAKTLTAGEYPGSMVNTILTASQGMPVDVGLTKRQFADGQVLWVVAWAPHLADMDPIPRTVPLDASVTLRIDRIDKGDARLFVAPPDGPVRELSMSSGVARWVDGFDVPGEYRFEVLADDDGQGSLALLFSVFADQQPQAMPPAPLPPDRSPDPRASETWLLDALNDLRREHGLHPVQPFSLFEGIAREHSALMGHTGIVAHSLPGHGTVSMRAAQFAHPRAEHHENVAAAPTAQDAMRLVELSPAHLQNLLCEPCTHVAIGASLEPVLDRLPRLFVTWELLEFPLGPPREIDDYNR